MKEVLRKPRNNSPTRLCKKCNVVKDITEYYENKKNPQWNYNTCRECEKKRCRQINWALRDSLNPDEAELLRNTVKQCQVCNKESILHVDHDHATGKIRGMLCFSCNAALGLLKDNKDLCLKAAEYLEEAQKPI